MSHDLLMALVVFAFVSSITPGPNNMMLLASGVNFGFRRSVPHMLGIGIGFMVLLLATGLGLGQLLERFPVIYTTLKYVGAAYMLWLAWKLATTARMAEADGGLRVSFGQGVLLQFVNIKAWMNALMISAGWITVAEPIAPRLAIVLPLMMAYGLASNFTYALIGSALRSWLAVGRRLAWFNRALAAVLVATAAWMAVL